MSEHYRALSVIYIAGCRVLRCDFRVVILSALARWSVALPVADRRCFGMGEAEPVSSSLSGLVCTA